MQLEVELLLHVYASTGLAICTLLIVPTEVFDQELEQRNFVEEAGNKRRFLSA